MNPRVSIIMPAYNAERYIAAAIDSVIAQTYQAWELIVIDDGSRDRTAEIVKSYLAADVRIRYIFQENRKMSNARNNGIKHARGELIAFLDADDLWLPEKLALQVETLDRQQVDVVFGDGFIFTDDDTRDESRSFSGSEGRIAGSDMFELMLTGNKIAVLSVMMRSETLTRVGGFDESPQILGCEDYELWLRLAEREASFCGMKEHLVRYRVHAGGVSSKRVEMLRAEIAVLRRYHARASQRGKVTGQIAHRRIAALYRELSSVLLAQGKSCDVRENLIQLRAFDATGLRTLAHILAVKILSRHYNEMRGRWIAFRQAGKPKRSPLASETVFKFDDR
ncbi:MAG: glycosyltransferase [Pyrinomonadaceae bacterium MAG19_C2-C3]|nr:glycosyltransferase [Pyrinomonadaceae bacterium MAG19_C2-C3]